MSRVARIATVCSAAICGGAACAQPAAAERPLGRTMARAARAIAGIVRADARRLARSEQTGAVVSRRCCHTRALRVFYRSRPWGYLPWFGAYELTLTSTRDFLGAVSISYFPTPPSWPYGAPAQREGPTYSFTITGPGRHRGWSFSATDSFLGCGERSPSPLPSIGVCEGSSQAIGFDERRGSAREFSRLFRQAIVVTQKARRHEPISGENLFPGPSSGR